jgi:spore germination protein GerM
VGHPLEAKVELKEMLKKDQALEEALKELLCGPEEDIRSWLQEMVPNYVPNGNGFY